MHPGDDGAAAVSDTGDGWRAGSALRLAVVFWGFGYVLADIAGVLLGRTAPGLGFVTSVPMFLLGVGQTVAIDQTRMALREQAPALRWTALIVFVTAATLIQALFDLHWTRWLALNVAPDWQEWALQITRQRVASNSVLYLWAFTLALTLLWAMRVSWTAEAAGARLARAEAAAATAEASRHRAEAAALRLQLNPHFLFNTMNSISSLVVTDRKGEAEDMIERLCAFLRASLNDDPMADVSLAQEIDTIDSYLAIEAARFGERLRIDIQVEDGTSEAQVPNFILQPLVENAIKHGIGAFTGPAWLVIMASRAGEELVLTVANSCADAGAEEASLLPPPRNGIGLANTRQRLLNRYGDRARLETEIGAGDYRAVIRLPFTTQPRVSSD